MPSTKSRPIQDRPVWDRPRPRPIPPLDRVQGLVDIAASYLDTLPGEPNDDHTLVIVHVNATHLTDNITEAAGDVPAGTPDHTDQTAQSVRAGRAGRAAQQLRSGRCHIEGHGPIEPATAARLACTATLLGAVIDTHGDVLALGHTTRLATRAQRRALRIRDHHHCAPFWTSCRIVSGQEGCRHAQEV